MEESDVSFCQVKRQFHELWAENTIHRNNYLKIATIDKMATDIEFIKKT